MAFITETSDNIKLEYPKLYESILNKMTAKNVDINSLEWGYDYFVLIDNSDKPTTLTETIDDIKRRYGISIKATSGKKRTEELIKRAGEYGELPSVFIKIAQNIWNENNKKIISQNNLVTNLDSVLKAVGKSGSAKYTEPVFNIGNGLDFMNHLKNLIQSQQPVYPELSDIKKVRPDIYQNYIDKADGTVIIIYAPQHKECDEWGFISEPVLLATRRNNDTRFITTDYGSHYVCKVNELKNESFLPWGGSLQKIDKAFAALEGQNFTGWKRTKQYRLTKNEIDTYLKSKIFKHGGLSF